jgi:hypothetical protein
MDTDIGPVEIVPEGNGRPKYLVFDPDFTEPWVTDLHEILVELRALDVATIFLLTPKTHIERVRITSTDGDPDYLDWEVTLVESGEVVERLEYDPNCNDGSDKGAYRISHVHGFSG